MLRETTSRGLCELVSHQSPPRVWAGTREVSTIKLCAWEGDRGGNVLRRRRGLCVFITAGPIIKLCAGGEGDSDGHVL